MTLADLYNEIREQMTQNSKAGRFELNDLPVCIRVSDDTGRNHRWHRLTQLTPYTIQLGDAPEPMWELNGAMPILGHRIARAEG